MSFWKKKSHFANLQWFVCATHSLAYKQPKGICGISGVIPCPCGLAQWLEHRHHKASATVAFRKPFYYFCIYSIKSEKNEFSAA